VVAGMLRRGWGQRLVYTPCYSITTTKYDPLWGQRLVHTPCYSITTTKYDPLYYLTTPHHLHENPSPETTVNTDPITLYRGPSGPNTHTTRTPQDGSVTR
jgi:hypothetical protein